MGEPLATTMKKSSFIHHYYCQGFFIMETIAHRYSGTQSFETALRADSNWLCWMQTRHINLLIVYYSKYIASVFACINYKVREKYWKRLRSCWGRHTNLLRPFWINEKALGLILEMYLLFWTVANVFLRY